MADKLNQFRETAFFIRPAGARGRRRKPRNSSLVLEITPQGGKKVTNVLTATKPVTQASEIPAVAGAAFAAGA